MSFYEINFSALHQVNPLFASTLPLEDTPLHYEVFMDENSIESLNLVHTTLFKPLYDTAPNLALAEQMASFEVFQEYPYFYFFGLGNGVLLKYLLSNQRLKRLVVIEPDPQIAYIVLHMIDFSQEIREGRLMILGQEQLDFPTMAPLFKELDVQRYAKLYYLHVMSPFYEVFQELIHQSNHLFIETIHHAIVLAGNDTKDALIGLKHHMTNLPSIPHTPPLFDLIKKVGTTDVAVLVSTGPSLAKQLPLLKKIAPYVRIFAVDASLPILIKYGIKPDVVTSIERVALTSRFFKETPKEAMKGVITVLSSLQHAEVIDSVQSSDVIISLRPLGYMRVTGPKEWGYIGIGMSAANMAYELIYHSHFKTCILIGQDLAYGKDGKSHASGHVFGEDDVKQSEIDGWTVAYGGEGKVKTTAVWNMFRGFFEKDIAEAKARMETINATEGGARIFGAIELPFETALSLHVKQKSPKSAVKLSQISSKDITTITQNVVDKVTSIEAYLHATQHEVETLFLKVAHTCDDLEAKREVTTETMYDLLKAIEGIRAKSKEEIFDQVIWHIAQSMMLVQEITIAPIEVRYAPDEASRRQKMVDLMYVYKGWLFSLAGSIDAIVKTMDYGKGRALIHTVHAIDVWLGNTKIDTITCKDMKAHNGRVFDVEMRGILYDVPDLYLEESSKIIFKKADTQEILPPDFIRVIERTDDSYNEYYFAQNISNPIDEEKIKVLCKQNNIGFLVTKENLEDQDFVKYIKVLLIKFPTLNFKAFYMTTRQKQILENIFSTDITKIECIKLLDIYDIPTRVKVFVCTNHTPFDSYLWEILRFYSNVVMVYHTALSREYTIGSVIDLYKARSHPVFTKPNFFGFEQSELIAKDYSLEKLFYEPFMGRISDDENLYDFLYFKLVSELLTNSELRKFYITFAKNEARYLDLQKKNEL
jgi:hypothetical protein